MIHFVAFEKDSFFFSYGCPQTKTVSDFILRRNGEKVCF